MKRLVLIAIAIMALGGCSSSPASPAEVTVAMGYVPNVQYAPFFVAEKKGYFAAQGLRLKYDWGFEVDGIKLVAAKQIDFAIVGGDQVLQARAQGIPIVYVANWYNAYPVEVISPKEKNIVNPQDLVGKRVGMPCFCGATYTGWRALLYNQKIDPEAVNVRDIGFTQVQALSQGTVDAVGVYANNEPVQLKLAGKEINEIKVWEYAKLVGNGVATNEDTIRDRPDLVRRFVGALLKGIADTIADPAAALDASVAAYQEIGQDTRTSQAVLAASTPLWANTRLGASREEDWTAMEKFMRESDLLQQDVDVEKAFTNKFLP